MKRNTGNNIGLGIFVSGGLALFVIGIYFIGERRQLFSNTFQVSTVFKNINGLQVGATVRFSGIDVGIVNNITQTTDTTVKVDVQIDERTRKFIKKDAKASIGSDGLMGNKLLLIAPGTSSQPVIQNHDFIAASSPIDLDDVMVKLKTTGDNAYNIVADMATITHNIRAGKGTIGMLFTDTVFAQNLAGTLINVKQGAKGFERNMDAASHTFLLKGFFKKTEKKTEKKEEPKKASNQ
jgi:phospholipid/cholesterol/gamma-HCH transport system substrate-binding protein